MPVLIGSSSDIELPVLTSQSFQRPPHEQVSSSSLVPETNIENHTANPTAVVQVKPPTLTSPPPDNTPPPSFDADHLASTRAHGHSEIPLSPGQGEDDRASGEALPEYKADHPPVYSMPEPTTWSMICFKIGFIIPFFWICGALPLIMSRDSVSRIFMPCFRDFVPSPESWCDDNLETEAEREAYLARTHAVDMAWARKCLFAFSLLLSCIVLLVVVVVVVSKGVAIN